MKILTLNSGSSSLKFAAFEKRASQLTEHIRGAIERIGQDDAQLVFAAPSGAIESQRLGTARHVSQTLEVIWNLLTRYDFEQIDAVGHRIVHGGRDLTKPVLIDSDVLEQLQDLATFAPLHQSVQLEIVQAVRVYVPDMNQVACFDTAFHRTIPEIAYRYPLPERYEREGIRKYGFHGLSCESILNTMVEARRGKTIIAHLGNGCSITAIQNGQSVDTTMGMTPTSGVMMGTRCGDLDPGVLVHLMRSRSMTADALERVINEESGLMGVSGISNSVKTLLDHPDDPRAELALKMFCYRIAKAIGEMTVALGGLDRLIFTGGIGERSSGIRKRICQPLATLGIQIDDKKNDQHSPAMHLDQSKVSIHVLSTNEEEIIAKHVSDVLSHS